MLPLLSDSTLFRNIPMSDMFGIAESNQCPYCRQEVLNECIQEHPEWFTPVKKEIKQNFLMKVGQYIGSHVKTVRCFTFTYLEGGYCSCCEGGPATEYICKRHLQEWVDQL